MPDNTRDALNQALSGQFNRLRDIRTLDAQKRSTLEPVRTPIPAEVFEKDGAIEVYGKPGYVWIHEYGMDESPAQALEGGIVVQAGDWVWVLKDPKEPAPWKIIGYYNANYNTGMTRHLVSKHGENHQIPTEANPGIDPVLIYQPALQVLKTTGDGATLTASTQDYLYFLNGVRKYFQGSTTDLTAYVPAVGLTLRALVYLDTATNLLSVVAGSSVAHGGAAPIPYPDLPVGGVASAYVQLYGGQTSITTATEIVDARDFLGGSGGGGAGGHDFPTRNVVTSIYAGVGGDDNVIMGYAAGAELRSSADNNVILGSYAGSIGSNSGNVLIGYKVSSGANADPDQSVVIGQEAGEDGDFGYDVIIGYRAGRYADTSSSVIIGRDAGKYEGGSHNVIMGAYACDATGFDGTHNVFIGAYVAGNTGTDGPFYNTVVGPFAGSVLNDCGYNTILGALSADDLDDGNYNVFLGAFSGASITDSNYSVYLGVFAGPSTVAAVSRRLYIDTHSTDDPLIYGEFDDHNIGFNTNDMAGGIGVIAIKDATTLPAGVPVGGGVMYINAGALTYKGSAGTVTVLAPA